MFFESYCLASANQQRKRDDESEWIRTSIEIFDVRLIELMIGIFRYFCVREWSLLCYFELVVV